MSRSWNRFSALTTTRRSLELNFFRMSLKYFAPAFGWGIFILIASTLPSKKVPSLLLEVSDKWIHGVIYFLAALLIYGGFIRYQFKNPISRKNLWFIVLTCILYGGILELVQEFMVPSRSGDWFDFFANTCGSIIAVLIVRLFHRIIA